MCGRKAVSDDEANAVFIRVHRFSWPDQAPMMNGRGLYNPNMNNLGMQNGFGFLPTEVPL